MTTDLQALWQENRRWRQWMDANTPFVTPDDPVDTLRYARDEAASEVKMEYLALSLAQVSASQASDRWMRSRLTEHARNNVRRSTLYEELADVAMLLLTALPTGNGFSPDPICMIDGLDELCFTLALAVVNCGEYADNWCVNASDSLHFIATYPDFDLTAELRKCHRRLAWKHGNAALAEQAQGDAMPWEAAEVTG